MSSASNIPHYIGGRMVSSAGTRTLPVTCPLDGSTMGALAPAGREMVDTAVETARAAAQLWSATPVKERVQVFFRFKEVVERRLTELSRLVSEENGKTESEAEAGIRRGLEVVEFVTALPILLAGEILEVSGGVDCQARRYPLGVTAGITPFNFPAMVPMWMFPLAIGCGNAFILKPSEQVPHTPLRLAELLTAAGLPPGVFSVLQGDRETSEAILDHPDVQAVAFVGSTAAARAVYRRGSDRGKRVVALGGAKNHLVVMPDADPEVTIRNVVSSAMGCAGQRCMAASVLLAVGKNPGIEAIVDGIVREAGELLVGRDVGAIISAAARDRIVRYIDRAESRGARIRLDGRGAAPPGREGGYYVGPTVIDELSPEDECLRDEIFGPVLSVLRVDSLEEAIAFENRSPYGNAAAIYTQDGGAASLFEERAGAGMVGINIGVPVPRDPFSFGGWNESRFGACDITGRDAIIFWTRLKKTTRKWSVRDPRNWMG